MTEQMNTPSDITWAPSYNTKWAEEYTEAIQKPTEVKVSAEDAKKIAYIKEKYGENAEVILQTYGAMAADIDKNFEKYYSGKVFFGRNYWRDAKSSSKRAKEGKKNQALFEQGKLSLAEAARIINCPRYFGTMQYTVDKLSAEIKRSSVKYRAAHQPKTEKKKTEQTQTQQPEKTKEKVSQKDNSTKKEMKNQRTVAEIKPIEIQLDEVVVTASAPQKKLEDMLAVKAKAPDLSEVKLQTKSPAERKYDELMAQKAAKMPDEAMGKKGSEIGLTIGDLMDLGVDPIGDFQSILKSMDRDAAAKLIPEKGFKDKTVVVSKELAIAAIARVQVREAQKKRGKQRA